MDQRITRETDPEVALLAKEVRVILILTQSMGTDQVRRLVRDPIPFMEFKACIFVQQFVTDFTLQCLALNARKSGNWFFTCL